MVTHENLYRITQSLRFRGVQKDKIQIILTKDSIKSLLDAEVEFMDIKPGQVVQQTDMFFGGYRVYLGGQDRVQIVESEIWL